MHLYTNNEISEREIKETTPFTITSKRIKYLGINLTKEVEDLYLENYKTVMKEIEDNANRWKDIPCSQFGSVNIKMTILPRGICRFNVMSIKITNKFFTVLEQIILKFLWKQKILSSQNNLEKEQSWRHHAPSFQTILQSYSNQNNMVLVQKQTHRSIERNRDPRNKPTLI